MLHGGKRYVDLYGAARKFCMFLDLFGFYHFSCKVNFPVYINPGLLFNELSYNACQIIKHAEFFPSKYLFITNGILKWI